MSGRRREGLTPTLFPFLAVLVCTLGTLILLLALVAQNAGEAIAASQSSSVDPRELEQSDEAKALAQAAADIDRRLREAQWYRTQTVQMRDEQTADLEQRRDQLAHLEDHVRRLREELELLSSEVELSLEKKGDAQEAQRTLDQLLTQIETEKTTLGQLQNDFQSSKPRIVIVPHKGPNGTDRRPIYIQCDRNGVCLQPGGQRIDLANLEPINGRPNPLDAALRTIRHHAMKTYGDSVAPYPLLVVTPGGIETYAVARAAMSHWDDQFGYELIPDGMELAFPAADPVLDDKIAAAIRQAIAQREAIARGGGGGGGNGAGRGHVGGAKGAGFGGGTGSGGGPGTGGPGIGELAGAPAGAAAAGTDPLAGGRGSGGDRAMQPTHSLPVLSAAQMSRGDYSGATGHSGSNLHGSAALSGPGSSGGQARSGAHGGMTTGTQGGPTAAEREAVAEAQRRLEQQDQLQSQWDTASGSLGSALLPGGQGSQGSGGAAAGGPFALNAPQGTAAGAEAANPAPGGTAASNSALGSSAGGTMAGSAGGTASNAGAGTQGAPSGATGGTGGSQASGSAAMAQAQGQPSDAAGSPSLSFGNTSTPPVTRVGKDWGLPSSLISSRGTEMLRTIRMECHADRFVLLPEGGRGTPTTFRFDDGDINRASLELATAVRDRAAGWGAAMQGARWQPVLDVTIASGGEVRYQQLLRLMDGSGVTIQARETR